MERWPKPRDLVVVGLDLAWSPRNPSGGCIASWDGTAARLAEAPRADLGDNDAIVDYVVRAVGDRPAVVAIDCPLAVPNKTGLRDCDRLVNQVFRKYEAGVYPANRGNLGRYGGLRGVGLSRALAAEGFSLDPRSFAERRVIEVYPHAAMIGLFGLRRTLKYKSRQGRSYPERWRELGRLQAYLAGLGTADPSFRIGRVGLGGTPRGLRGKAFKTLEDALDALLCGYVALLYGVKGLRRCAVFGTATSGHIVIPMTNDLWRDTPSGERVAFEGGL